MQKFFLTFPVLRDFQYLMGHDCQIDEDEAYRESCVTT